MQSKWNANRMCVSHSMFHGAVGAIVATLITPTPAWAMTYEEAVEAVTSSPPSFGAGAVAGGLAVGVVSHMMHKRSQKRAEHEPHEQELPIQEKNEEHPVQDTLGETDQPTSAINMQALINDEKSDLGETGRHFAQASTHDADAAPERPATAVAAGKPVPEPTAKPLQVPHVQDPVVQDSSARRRGLDTTLGDLLHVADDNDFPVIERGESSLELLGTRAELERTHSMQVLKSMDRRTRAKMIAKRLPNIGNLNAVADISLNEAKGDDVSPDTSAALPLDPSDRVEMILQEELKLNEARVAREYSRSKLVLLKGTGNGSSSASESSLSYSHRPRGKHFAPESREA